jgi:hypothetical protein
VRRRPGARTNATEAALAVSAEPSERDGAQDGAQRSARLLANIRWATLVALVMLVIEFTLGAAVNLYVTVPSADHGTGLATAIGKSLTNGPGALAAHVGLGLLLTAAAILLLVLAILARHTPLVVHATIGLLAVLAAEASGATFVGRGNASASLSMAIATGIALLVYIAIVVILGSTARHR